MIRTILAALVAVFLSAPALAQSKANCFTTNLSNCVPAIQASTSKAISIAAATTTEIIPLATGANIYVTAFDLVGGGAGNVTLVYGTGTNCGTGTTALTGAYPLAAQTVLTKGNGLGPLFVIPPGNALCVTTSATAQVSGSVSYVQF